LLNPWRKLAAFRIAEMDDGQGFSLVDGDGETYSLKKIAADATHPIRLSITKNNINVVSAAASLAAGIGGSAGVAISGAGAFSQNVILTHTNAFVDSSVVDSAGDVALEAKSTSAIQSTVAAAS